MEDSNVETRLDTLEQQVRKILGAINGDDSTGRQVKDWRKCLGMFNDRPVMKQIDREGQQIRQQDREQVANDHS